MALAGEDPTALDAILITHEHIDHVAGLPVLARRLNIPVFFTEPTHRAWVRMVTPRTTMSYAEWLDHLQREKETRAAQTAAAFSTSRSHHQHRRRSSRSLRDPALRRPEPNPRTPRRPRRRRTLRPSHKEKLNPATLPAVEYFHPGSNFSIGDLDITPFTIPHDAADPCGFVFHSRSSPSAWPSPPTSAMSLPTSRPPSKPSTFSCSNPTTTSRCFATVPTLVRQAACPLPRGHLSNHATAEFLSNDYDGAATYIVLGHLSESNNVPELARLAAEQALIAHPTLLGNRVLLAHQSAPLDPISL